MAATLPFLTTYDPPGTSEGSLDPLGLYQIADQLAVQLVPAVRERMQRIRFLTAMAVGSLVTEGLEDDPRLRDASPYLAWEWLVVEALIRERRSDPGIWGVPGSQVVHRALGQHGYIDARSYLKTPRIFGFNGVYKRLATHLGLVDVHLGPGPSTEHLVDAWARGLGFAGIGAARRMISRWSPTSPISISTSTTASSRRFSTLCPSIEQRLRDAVGECVTCSIGYTVEPPGTQCRSIGDGRILPPGHRRPPAHAGVCRRDDVTGLRGTPPFATTRKRH